jgi:acyl dehydratase
MDPSGTIDRQHHHVPKYLADLDRHPIMIDHGGKTLLMAGTCTRLMGGALTCMGSSYGCIHPTST